MTAVSGRHRVPWTHWVTLALLLALMLGVLTVHAYAGTTNAEPDGTITPSPAGQVLRMEGDRLSGHSLPARTVALTFHGGPDPKWTPKVLDALAARGTHATFFLTGARINEHPGLVRRMVAEGHEVAVTGFRSGDPTTLPGWRLRLELSLAQGALADATGSHTRLFGLPPEPAGRAVQRLGRAGYLLVNADVDGQEPHWEGVGDTVGEIASAAEHGAVVRMRDAGSLTVDAVWATLDVLGRGGYRFTTLSDGLDLADPVVSADGLDRFTGQLLAWAQRNGGALGVLLDVSIAVAAMLAMVRILLQLGLAHTARRLARERALRPEPPPFVPPVSVVVPAHNEAATIVATVRSLVATRYPAEVEIIVVDDGSTDGTAELVHGLALPAVRVLRRANAGKPAALNTGVAAARHEILLMVDADTEFEPETIGHLVRPLADQRVGSVSGNTKVGNRDGLLGRWQHLEYCAGSNLDRQILDALECISTVPGAIGAFRRQALAEVGGVSADTLAEDTDLTIALSRAGWRVSYAQRARAWTEVPGTLSGLYRQRYRWSYGTFQSMWKHRGALVERGRAGRMGRCGLLYLFLYQLVLPLLAPVMDVYVLYGLFIADAPGALVLWTAFLAVQTAGAGYAMRLDGESLRPLWAYPLQQVAYRQLVYLVVIQSLVTALHGTRLRWNSGRSQRAGSETVTS
ncbi:glycosyltransferase [Amycolatopsis aidingensis]|uniref:glycosyltransferase n=1 Tax=Amycolatopsis aidingensis TaxID=2842453 RepID=UPI001C0DAB99|nr:glycosyltransferase [Amycolatopsis aidingensis]